MSQTVRRADLVAAAKELNDVLGLSPQIEVETITSDEMKDLLLEASGLIEPSDEITRETARTLSLLEEASEREMTVTTVGGTVVPAQKVYKPKTLPRPNPNKAMSRTEALIEALRRVEGERFTTSEIVASSVDIYDAANLKKSDAKGERGARAIWRTARNFLLVTGLLEKIEEREYRFSWYYEEEPETTVSAGKEGKKNDRKVNK